MEKTTSGEDKKENIKKKKKLEKHYHSFNALKKVQKLISALHNHTGSN